MFLKTHRENPAAPSMIFLLFALAIIALYGAANVTDAQTNKSAYLDFTGDGKTDWAVIKYPQAPGQPIRWKILGNPASSAPNAAFIRIFDYGLAGDDVIVPGDYTGDRKTELTVYRRGTPGIFYVAQFPIGTGGITLERAVPWGTALDNSLAQGDYDGDGKLDFTVVRRDYSTGGLTWYILSSSTGVMRAVPFGNIDNFLQSGADFTGDGRDELVVTNGSNGGIYSVADAITGAHILSREWGYSGNTTDVHLPPADYTGDGKADFVAVRFGNTNPMVWYILDPATNTATATPFGVGLGTPGISYDKPIQGDYDGDGRLDIAVYRRSNQTFYVLRSSDGGLTAQTWGDAGDDPLLSTMFVIFL